ncbi:methyl-accepting chemotaxis protein [Paucibacter soli]|uniref:methyl-accepting chemotaxis protein n=1 Tax=Paucibacter soli TaxID=3133433 RepID=UPI003098B0A4
MSKRRIQVASFSMGDVARGDLASIACGVLLFAVSAILAVASNTNARATAASAGAARLLHASSSQVLQGAQSFGSGGAPRLGIATTSSSQVTAAFKDLAGSADSVLALPSIKTPAAEAYAAWGNLRGTMSAVGQGAASAAELSDALGRSGQAIHSLTKKIEASGKQSGSMARAYESVNRLLVIAETGFGLASVQRVGYDLQVLAADLGSTELRQEIAFIEPLAALTKAASAIKVSRDQLAPISEAAISAKAAADNLANAASQSGGSAALGGAAALLALIGVVAVILGLRGALSEFSRRYARATQQFRSSEQARIDLAQSLRSLQDGSLSDEIEIPQSSPEMAELARLVNSVIGRVRLSIEQVESSLQDGVANNAEIVEIAAALRQQVANASGELIADVKSLDGCARSATSISFDAESLVNAAGEASTQSADATRVAQDAASRLDSMRDGLQDTAKRVKRLGERALEISTVVEGLEALSEQIGVLALNAELEAERAGDAGVGFRTVAREVKALARRAESSLLAISGLVQGVQADARSAAESVERSTGQVVAGANVGAVSQALLSVLAPLAETIGAMAREIQVRAKATAEASRQSSASANGLQRGLDEVIARADRLQRPTAASRESMQQALRSITGMKSSAEAI